MSDVPDWEREGLLDGLADAEARAARVALLDQLHDEGIPLAELRAAVEQHRLALLPIEQALAGGGDRLTLREVSERAGLEYDTLRRFRAAFGLPLPDEGDRLFTEHDVAGVATSNVFLRAGVDHVDQLDLARVIGRNLAQIAEAIRAVTRKQLTRPGETERDVALRYAALAGAAAPALGPLLEQILSDHLRSQIRQEVLVASDVAAGRVVLSEAAVSVCFADLVGFTPLGEEVPTEEVGAVARRLGELAVDVARPPVRLVKLIGDAAMLVSREPEALVNAGLELVAAAEAEGDEFPMLRVGAALGEAVSHGGDWYGRPVNLASRLTSRARPGSMLAVEEVKEAVGEEAFAWSFAGRKRLKGVRDEVPVWRVRVAADR